MSIAAILSTRSYLKESFYHLIYEWEDDLAHRLNVPIMTGRPLFRRLLYNKLTRSLLTTIGSGTVEQANNWVERANIFRPSNGYYLVFELGVNTQPNFSTSSKAIPAFIDLWKQTDLNEFHKIYGGCPLVLISSLETVNYIKSQGSELKIAHFPLSLSDRYKAAPSKVYKKEYDILLAGRTNPVLTSYLHEFVAKNPDVEFLSQQEIAGETYYVSNKRGTIGRFQTRDEYIQLLRTSKISFYSTPGIDGGEKRTGGFNPVTPRFLELLSAQCLLIGRYPDNEETRFYQLNEVCPSVESYLEFEQLMQQYLAQGQVPLAQYESILEKHYTSRRATQLLELTSQLK